MSKLVVIRKGIFELSFRKIKTERWSLSFRQTYENKHNDRQTDAQAYTGRKKRKEHTDKQTDTHAYTGTKTERKRDRKVESRKAER